VLWASEDKVMPPEHGRRLAEIIPNARYSEVDDAYTLLPLDQPDRVAEHLTSFAARVG
jgi:pimeloyl-ACP methyl ester carboxylesterase